MIDADEYPVPVPSDGVCPLCGAIAEWDGIARYCKDCGWSG